jgi:hypothetical protein
MQMMGDWQMWMWAGFFALAPAMPAASPWLGLRLRRTAAAG